MDLDLKVGDIVLGGKFKNKRTIVKTIGKDELGQPTINGRSMLNFRIEKDLPKDKQSKETREKEDSMKKESKTITKSELRQLVKEVLLQEAPSGVDHYEDIIMDAAAAAADSIKNSGASYNSDLFRVIFTAIKEPVLKHINDEFDYQSGHT